MILILRNTEWGGEDWNRGMRIVNSQKRKEKEKEKEKYNRPQVKSIYIRGLQLHFLLPYPHYLSNKKMTESPPAFFK
jgi:hypothetical protein